MNMPSVIRFLCFFALLSPLKAQQLAHFDLILLSASIGPDSIWKPSAPRFLSQFNPQGYNNQPSFVSASELYLTVQTPEDTTQTDIWALNLGTQTRLRITATEQTAEYSPVLMPGGKRFSAVRVEEDGVQHLWSFPLDRSDNGRVEFPKIADVGYHCWVNDTLAALFIVGKSPQPHQLFTAGIKSQQLSRVASNVGRSLVALPNNRFAFVAKSTEQTWFLKIWDVRKQSAQIVVKMPVGTEDFSVLPDGTYLAGNNAKLFQYKPGRNADWVEIADLSKYGVKQITRIATNKAGKIVVVVQ
jgi:Tol biopolymer transport system component